MRRWHRHQHDQRAKSSRRRSASITLELILSLPVLVIMVLAVVEFAILFTSLRHVEFASRVGAKVAAELSTTDINLAASANTVKSAVDRSLATVNRSSCQVIVEHNAPCDGLTPQMHISTATCAGCNALADPLPSVTDVQSGSVRVTVCIDAANLAPDLLSFAGFSIDGRIVSVSTTYPYENCSGGPTVIPVSNASFETPIVATGAAGAISDWTTTAGTGEVFYPNPADNHFTSVPDGTQVARLTPPTPGDATIRQVLTTNVENGADYLLSVQIGDSTLTDAPSSWTVRLLAAGGTVLGTQTVNAGAGPSGAFDLVTVTGTGNGATAGQALVIELTATNNGGNTGIGYFDDVNLVKRD